MSLSDVLFPGNPERREKLIRKSQELIELMKSNFEATNSLTEIVNKNLGSSFRPITLNEKATVKENCDVMIERVNQIQAKVEQVDKELKEKLDPTLYEHLQKIPLHGFKNIPAGVKGAIGAVCQISAFVLVAYLMKKTEILKNITSVWYKIGISLGGMVVSVLLGLVVDLIISAIAGAVERDKLEAALAEYDKVLKTFRPASKEYQEAIYEVKFCLKCSGGQ
ncbi:hypothetical protein QQF64_026351 [Cirrhinus molitorella]|uniref:Uncharacterized protein n=1 Tax=Cirrhinus molitorella TaxID=172907 RepID=A0ABR3N9W4_9TELE